MVSCTRQDAFDNKIPWKPKLGLTWDPSRLRSIFQREAEGQKSLLDYLKCKVNHESRLGSNYVSSCLSMNSFTTGHGTLWDFLEIANY